jgi:ABC-type transport system involved in multi-copper enzyme maturation permease subunit
MNVQAIIAVFKRNLASYFGSPSGYVFICAFLLASGVAAFCTDDFFDSNLANLDQLNEWLPSILLGFIPAITMSVWADERRQGTDELLLTLPGSDLDVVLGKYFAAVAIFSVSLIVSLGANFVVLKQLGNPDFGLLFSTYVGYLFAGLTMLAIGMVASFLTANLTVAFVLGVAFNAPIALLQNDVILAIPLTDWNLTVFMSEWTVSSNLLDFTRGILSFSGIVFFVGMAAAMLYLCSILIGRRHWAGSQDGAGKTRHFLVRVVAALVIAFSFTFFARNHDGRIDVTEEQLSHLSDGSIAILKEIDEDYKKSLAIRSSMGADTPPPRPIQIDAFVSPADTMPKQYVQTRINLLTALREIDRQSKNILVNVHVISPEDAAAATAEKYGIANQNGVSPPLMVEESEGNFVPWQKDLYLGVVFKGQNEHKTIPFLYSGLPAEYEIMRTLNSVRNLPIINLMSSKKKLGVFMTDAPVMGTPGNMMMGMNLGGGAPAWEVITELKKQYDVQEVTGGSIKKGDYDVLLVVQPSTLDDAKMDDLVGAIKAGIPTAIFEDPLPLLQGPTGTYEARRSEQQGGPGQPPPTPPQKGDLNKLWDLLGVHFNVDPKERLAAIRKELEGLSKIATFNLAPLRGRVPEIGSFFSALDSLIQKGNEFDARLKANSSLTASDWDSLKLSSLRTSLEGLDYSNPYRRSIEEQIISPAENRVNGLGQRVLRDPYNPIREIPRSKQFLDEFVYVGGYPNSFDQSNPATSELQICLFTCPGSLYQSGKGSLTYTPLLKTKGGKLSGTTSLDNFWTGGFFGSPRSPNPERTTHSGTGKQETIAAAISGTVQDEEESSDINVVLVADVDVLTNAFYDIRSNPNQFPAKLDNVTLSLNLIDHLSKEERLLEIRNRRRLHRTLEEFEESIEDAREVASETIAKAKDSMDQIISEERLKLNEALAGVQQNQGGMTQGQFMQVLQTEGAKLQKNLERRQRELEKETNGKIKEAELNRDILIRAMEGKVQLMSVLLPPIPLLIIAIAVFYRKKSAEIQGAASSRVRS